MYAGVSISTGPVRLNQGDNLMRYMLLCYDDDAAWERAGDKALREAMDEAVQLTHEIDAKGQYVTAAPLHPVATATSVRVREGKRLVTDGPSSRRASTWGAST
jgi:hypothetical protein